MDSSEYTDRLVFAAQAEIDAFLPSTLNGFSTKALFGIVLKEKHLWVIIKNRWDITKLFFH